MACYLTAPSHYLNQCWHIISEVLWHSPEGKFSGNTQDTYPWYEFVNNSLKITAASPRNQRVLLCQGKPILHDGVNANALTYILAVVPFSIHLRQACPFFYFSLGKMKFLFGTLPNLVVLIVWSCPQTAYGHQQLCSSIRNVSILPQAIHLLMFFLFVKNSYLIHTYPSGTNVEIFYQAAHLKSEAAGAKIKKTIGFICK